MPTVVVRCYMALLSRGDGEHEDVQLLGPFN